MPTGPHPNAGALFPDVRLVVFDLDGTLVDAFGDIADAVNAMLRDLERPPLTIDEVKRHVGRGVRMLAAGVLATDDDDLVTRAGTMITEHYAKSPHRHVKLYPGALEVVEALGRRGIATAVASNKPHMLTCAILERIGAAPLLTAFHGESSRFPRKPAPDLLLHIMEHCHASPSQTVVVGDTDIDIEFARNAGVAIVSVTYGQYPAEYLRRFSPDAIIDDLRDLLPMIDSGSERQPA